MSVIMQPPPEHCVPCRHCGKDVFAYEDARWVHFLPADKQGIEYPEGFTIRMQWTDGMIGCRAASFELEGTWNDALDRKKNAAPTCPK